MPAALSVPSKLVLLAQSSSGGASEQVHDFLEALEDDRQALVSGLLVIPNGDTDVVQALGSAFDGKIAVVSFGEAPTAASKIWAGPVTGGNLTIHIDVDNTADLDVYYIVDGR